MPGWIHGGSGFTEMFPRKAKYLRNRVWMGPGNVYFIFGVSGIQTFSGFLVRKTEIKEPKLTTHG